MGTPARTIEVELSAGSIEALTMSVAALIERAPVKGVLWTRKEAAAAMGVSLDTFERKVQPWLRLVPCGQLLLIPPAEIDRWIELHARRLIE